MITETRALAPEIAELHAEDARLRAELAELRSGLDNHPEFTLPDPDAAEARQSEERARIEALAREEEALAKEELQRDQFERAVEDWHCGASPRESLWAYLGITRGQHERYLDTGEIPEGWEPPADMQAEQIEFELA